MLKNFALNLERSGSASLFEKDVEKVISMGFNPLKMKFITALYVISCVGESSWAQKMEICKKCDRTE